jgi:hypothetical protein
LPLAFFSGENGLNVFKGMVGSTTRDLERMKDDSSFGRVILGGVDGGAIDCTIRLVVKGANALESFLYCLYLSAKIVV